MAHVSALFMTAARRHLSTSKKMFSTLEMARILKMGNVVQAMATYSAIPKARYTWGRVARRRAGVAILMHTVELAVSLVAALTLLRPLLARMDAAGLTSKMRLVTLLGRMVDAVVCMGKLNLHSPRALSQDPGGIPLMFIACCPIFGVFVPCSTINKLILCWQLLW